MKEVTLKPNMKPINKDTNTGPDINIDVPQEKRIRDTDSNYSWTVIGMSDCQFTKEAVQILKDHKERYKYIPINMDWQRKLAINYNTKRLPAVFQGTDYIGCISELRSYFDATFFSEAEEF